MEYAVSHMSLAHTFGNVTAYMTEYVKNLFPKDYFNTVNISSTVAYRYFNIFDNTNKEFIKKRKPMLIIRPRIEFDADDMYLSGSALTTRITDNYMDRDFTNLQNFFSDPEKGLHIKFLMNRIRMSFDVTIIVEQQMEQINKFFYIKNAVRHNRPFNMDTFLESNIHRSLVKTVAKQAGIDPTDIKAVLDYFNGHSCYPMTYKIKNSTGNDEFFRYHPAELDTTITGLSMDDGAKRGFVNDQSAINFTITTEFMTAGLYYFFTRDVDCIKEVIIDMEADRSIIPILTMSNDYEHIKPPAGWNLYAAPMFKVSVDGGSDMLDLTELMNASVKACIKYHIEKGLPLAQLVKMFAYKDAEELTEGTDFTFDYETYSLVVNRTNSTSTYRLLMYVNVLYVNDLVATLHKISEEK